MIYLMKKSFIILSLILLTITILLSPLQAYAGYEKANDDSQYALYQPITGSVNVNVISDNVNESTSNREIQITWNDFGETAKYQVFLLNNNHQQVGNALALYHPSALVYASPALDVYIRVMACLPSRTSASGPNCLNSQDVFFAKKESIDTINPIKAETQTLQVTPINPVATNLTVQSKIAIDTNTAVQEKKSDSKVEELNNKVNNLQKQLQESQKKQSVLEQTVNNLTNWIRSHFPFFK